MSQTLEVSRIGSPKRGTVRLRAPEPLIRGQLFLKWGDFVEDDYRTSALRPFAGKILDQLVVACDDIPVAWIEVMDCDLDVCLGNEREVGQTGQMARTLATICRKNGQPISFVGSSRRDFILL
jgi:hypothetical protein